MNFETECGVIWASTSIGLGRLKEHVGIVALRIDTTIKKINGKNENFNYERIIRVKSSEESL